MERGETLFPIRRDGQPVSQTTGREYSCQDAHYRRLWLSVIWRAVEDAAQKDMMLGKDAPKLTEPTSLEAREWLTTDSWWLRQVCELAGVDADKLLTVYRRTYGST